MDKLIARTMFCLGPALAFGIAFSLAAGAMPGLLFGCGLFAFGWHLTEDDDDDDNDTGSYLPA